MAVASNLRVGLRNALLGYMAGKIKSKSFDACVFPLAWARDSGDWSLMAIAQELYSVYDDASNVLFVRSDPDLHGVWATLCRIQAFLQTNLEMDPGVLGHLSGPQASNLSGFWPFGSEAEMSRYAHLVQDFSPGFAPGLHRQIVGKLQASWAHALWPVILLFALVIVIGLALWAYLSRRW